ncbi:hypothetical protein SNEBB_009137 [Seison nebaliae]|nr:hypothetical protein SNEBB_009137 [Seison nebaliae]
MVLRLLPFTRQFSLLYPVNRQECIRKISFVTKFREWKFIPKKTIYPKWRLMRCGRVIYISLAKLIDYEMIMKDQRMDDSFDSWVQVTTIHLWMLLVRLKQMDSSDSHLLSAELIRTFWEDVNNRMKQFDTVIKSKKKKEALAIWNDDFQYQLFQLDEGLLADDVVLANAIWCTMHKNNDNTKLRELYKMAKYVRGNLKHLKTMDERRLFKLGLVSFLSYGTMKLDETQIKKIHRQLLNI